MEKIIINPDNYESNYIKNLNECFNGWGGKREYDWVFGRKIGDHRSDILVIQNEEDGVIAGSGVTYRRLCRKGKSMDIGIMTGSWTLPAARRKGCFTKMINCSKELCRQKDVPFLTAFVTETNPSCRRLESEGSFMFPTYHLFSPEVPFENKGWPGAQEVEHNETSYKNVYETVKTRQLEFLNFDYEYGEFVGQYLNRIKPTTILKINDDYAILEDGTNEVKVLMFTYADNEALLKNMKAVTNWSLQHRTKKTFFFSTRKEVFKAGKKLGFQNLPGYFTILNSFDEELPYNEKFDALNINMADKM